MLFVEDHRATEMFDDERVPDCDTSDASKGSPEPLSPRPSVCAGCSMPIYEQFILRVHPNLEWHSACLKCYECGAMLDENMTCFVRDGKIFCKPDFNRIYTQEDEVRRAGPSCTRCSQEFSKEDFVMRAKTYLYHVNCFRCSTCDEILRPGDEFGVRSEGNLYCRHDFDQSDKYVEDLTDSSSIVSKEEESQQSAKSERSNRKSGDSSSTSSNGDKPTSGGGSSRSGGKKSSRKKGDSTKTTRIRTVLNEKQLHTLRTCYAANPRPDALMKEQLVEMSGLSPRVIRVWFQNKRCKDKKRIIAMKQAQHQAEKTGQHITGPIQGIPMVASDPIRHDPPSLPNPLEVQTFTQPNQPLWRPSPPMGDYGPAPNVPQLAPEGDVNPFHQLVSAFESSDPLHRLHSSPQTPPPPFGAPLFMQSRVVSSAEELSQIPTSLAAVTAASLVGDFDLPPIISSPPPINLAPPMAVQY